MSHEFCGVNEFDVPMSVELHMSDTFYVAWRFNTVLDFYVVNGVLVANEFYVANGFYEGDNFYVANWFNVAHTHTHAHGFHVTVPEKNQIITPIKKDEWLHLREEIQYYTYEKR